MNKCKFNKFEPKQLLSIVIVNWNSGRQLFDAVVSIAKYNHLLVTSVIIIDNGSVDSSLTQVEGLINLPFEMQIIRNNVNCGFGAACNQGAALIRDKYVLFLNPDTLIFEKSLPVVIEFMNDNNNQDVGIVGTKMRNEIGQVSRHCTRFPNALDFLAHTTGLDRFFINLGHVMTEWDHEHTRQVDHVIGAFYLVRHELFIALRGFDERFFVYLEDLDFSYRANMAGWRSVYLADAEVFHAGGGTSRQVKAKRLFYSLRSRLLYSFKHFVWYEAWAVLLSLLLIEPISRSTLALIQLSWPGLKETWQAYGLLWGWLPQWLLKVQTR